MPSNACCTPKTAGFLYLSFVSVWCFFAAAGSTVIYLFFIGALQLGCPYLLKRPAETLSEHTNRFSDAGDCAPDIPALTLPWHRPTSTTAVSVHVVELGHGRKQLPTAPYVSSGSLVYQLTAHDCVKHARAQDLVLWYGQQVPGKHHHVGQLAGTQ